MKPKTSFLKRWIKTDWAREKKKESKKEKTWIANIRNKRGDSATDTTEIKS